MPLAAAKLCGPCDAFKKGLQIVSFLSLLIRDDTKINPAVKPFLMQQGIAVSSNRATRGQMINTTKWITRTLGDNQTDSYGVKIQETMNKKFVQCWF